MKKKILTGIAALALAAIVGINVKMNSQDNQMTDIALANVDALADNESTPLVYSCYDWGCRASLYTSCEVYALGVYMGTCSYSRG